MGQRLVDPAGPQAERHVLEHRHVREQQVLLKHHAARTLLGLHEQSARRIVEHHTVDLDRSTFDRQQAGEATQDGRLARPVGTEQGDDFPIGRIQPHVEAERSTSDHDVRPQCHVAASPPPNHRSRERDEDGERNGHHQQREHDRLVLVGVEREVHRQRKCLRLAREAAGERDGGSELSERACPRQDCTGNECGPNRRQRDAAERVPRAGTKRARRLVVADVGLTQRSLDSDDEERHGDKRLSDHYTGRREGKLHIEPSIEPLTDEPATTQREQQGDATDDGWQHHRQRAQSTHHRSTDESATCQKPGQRKPEHDGQGSCAQAADDRQLECFTHVRASQDLADVTPRGPTDEAEERQRKEGDGDQCEEQRRPRQ